ncbi:MAG TPA: hypothetical protein VMB19_01545 [Silvibacterium sp.]|nr:hypothetical protein [Silvibacterium sp.]
MWHGALLLLLFAPALVAQTQYGSAAKPGSTGPMTHTRTGCPWLTEGSAAHALGGDVSVTADVSDMGEGICKFARKQGSTDFMEILVSKAGLPACPPGSVALKGIGNEALTCRHGESRGDSVEMINSRVRDFHFTVTLTVRGQKGSSKSDDPQNDALEQVAEQIAGNLY